MLSKEQECRNLLDTWGSRTADSPRAGREEADRLLREVELLGNPAELRARALAMSGSSWRALGQFEKAHQCYAEAESIYRELRCPNRQIALDEGDLLRRLALLFLCEGKLELAEGKAHEAVRLFQAADEKHLLGQALVALGIVELHLDKPVAVEILSRACTLVDPLTSLPEHHAALHNLAVALSVFEPSAALLEDCQRMVSEMRLGTRSRQPSRRDRQRQQVGRRQKTLPDAMARVLLGRVYNLLGQHEEGRKVLESAREDLAELGAPVDQAAASIELAESLLWSTNPRQWARIGALVDEALQLSSSFPRGEKELAALAKLKEASTAALSRRHLQEQLQVCRRLILESQVVAVGQQEVLNW